MTGCDVPHLYCTGIRAIIISIGKFIFTQKEIENYGENAQL